MKTDERVYIVPIQDRGTITSIRPDDGSPPESIYHVKRDEDGGDHLCRECELRSLEEERPALHQLVLVPGATVHDVLVAIEDEEPDDVASLLACTDRYDLLKALKDHYLYGEEATKELDMKARMDKMKAEFEAKCAKYPDQLKRFRRIVHASRKVGLFDVNYPSAIAAQFKLEGKFSAISGDGLFLFVLEVLSTEGPGQYKLHRNPTGHEPGDEEQTFLAATGGEYERPLTADMVAEALMQTFGVQEEPNE